MTLTETLARYLEALGVDVMELEALVAAIVKDFPDLADALEPMLLGLTEFLSKTLTPERAAWLAKEIRADLIRDRPGYFPHHPRMT